MKRVLLGLIVLGLLTESARAEKVIVLQPGGDVKTTVRFVQRPTYVLNTIGPGQPRTLYQHLYRHYPAHVANGFYFPTNPWWACPHMVIWDASMGTVTTPATAKAPTPRKEPPQSKEKPASGVPAKPADAPKPE